MKKLLTIAFCAMLFSSLAEARDQRNINNNWLFGEGENATEWKTVTLPYDWSVDSDSGKGCYRYVLDVKEFERGQHFSLRFDGIAGFSKVFVNGAKVGEIRNAYLSKVFDISPYLNFGKENVIMVTVDSESDYCSHHEGSGIFRNVYLTKTNPVFIPEFATDVYANFGKVYVSTSVSNMDYLYGNDASVHVKFNILDADGREVCTHNSEYRLVPQYGSAEFKADLHISIPHMWEIDDPYMYTLESIVYNNGEEVDRTYERFGVRDIVFDAAKGFVLNNRRVAIHGVSVPQEHFGTGSAIPDELWRYRLGKLKKMGVVVVSFGHNPASPSVLNICDEMGLMVIEENNDPGTGEYELMALSDLVNRDFNHPSVIMWSLGDEQSLSLPGEAGGSVVGRMSGYAKSLDPSRPTVFGISCGERALGAADINGYDGYRTNHPESGRLVHADWKSIGLNEPSYVPVTGTFEADEQLRATLDFYESNKWMSGMIFNSGFDSGNPDCHDGIFDYRGYPKNSAFLLMSAWTWNPTLHICGIHDGKVWVYTNCSSVSLTFNGKNLGTKVQLGSGYVSWPAPSATIKKISAKGSFKGTLAKAISLKSNYETVPSSFSAEFSKTSLKADGQDLVVLDITSTKPEALVTVAGPVCFVGSKPDIRSIAAPVIEGRVQLLLRSVEGERGQVRVKIEGKEYLLSCN